MASNSDSWSARVENGEGQMNFNETIDWEDNEKTEQEREEDEVDLSTRNDRTEKRLDEAMDALPLQNVIDEMYTTIQEALELSVDERRKKITGELRLTQADIDEIFKDEGEKNKKARLLMRLIVRPETYVQETCAKWGKQSDVRSYIRDKLIELSEYFKVKPFQYNGQIKEIRNYKTRSNKNLSHSDVTYEEFLYYMTSNSLVDYEQGKLILKRPVRYGPYAIGRKGYVVATDKRNAGYLLDILLTKKVSVTIRNDNENEDADVTTQNDSSVLGIIKSRLPNETTDAPQQRESSDGFVLVGKKNKTKDVKPKEVPNRVQQRKEEEPTKDKVVVYDYYVDVTTQSAPISNGIEFDSEDRTENPEFNKCVDECQHLKREHKVIIKKYASSQKIEKDEGRPVLPGVSTLTKFVAKCAQCDLNDEFEGKEIKFREQRVNGGKLTPIIQTTMEISELLEYLDEKLTFEKMIEDGTKKIHITKYDGLKSETVIIPVGVDMMAADTQKVYTLSETLITTRKRYGVKPKIRIVNEKGQSVSVPEQALVKLQEKLGVKVTVVDRVMHVDSYNDINFSAACWAITETIPESVIVKVVCETAEWIRVSSLLEKDKYKSTVEPRTILMKDDFIAKLQQVALAEREMAQKKDHADVKDDDANELIELRDRNRLLEEKLENIKIIIECAKDSMQGDVSRLVANKILEIVNLK